MTPKPNPPIRVLFLCTGNSCRSIIGEALLNHMGGDRWEGHSAGSKPTGKVHPGALEILAGKGVKVEGYKSKKWDSFGEISFDLVITVCDNAAAESCPYYVGRGLKAHWGLPDPAYAEKKEEAFQNTFAALQKRIADLLELPLDKLTDKEVVKKVNDIGKQITKPGPPTRVLFLCTGNSCRSIIGEALLNHMGGDRWEGHSAGSKPTGKVHPGALEILASKGVKVEGYKSKKWDSFGEISFDLVITVCDNAAAETCPYYVGRGLKAHWGLPDPAYAEKKEEAFQNTFAALQKRIADLLELPLEKLTDKEVVKKVNDIGKQNDKK